MYKDNSTAEKSKLYELRLARLEKEEPQGDRNKYVCKIKSLKSQLDESWMGNDDPSDDAADLSNSSHANFEGDGMDTKDNKNRVRQGGPRKRNKIKKWKKLDVRKWIFWSSPVCQRDYSGRCAYYAP